MSVYVDCAYKSLNKYGEELCGDKVEIRRGESGEFLAVLADGLGSGVKANILSTLTSTIIATMMSEGSPLEDVVDTIASTLPVCSERGVAYSTFTIIKIDKDGRLSLAEFDNPLAMFFSQKTQREISRKEVEIGGKKIFVSEFLLKEGDALMCFSDGITHAGVGRLLDLGWQRESICKFADENIAALSSPRSMTAKMLGAVAALYMDKPGDDSTVLSVYIKEEMPVTVMVGPPENKAMDEVVVRKLLGGKGKKIVCGGTTSQIVTRVTGRELKVHLDYENPAVPPTGEIYGIDLVTEGVLTLGKALEIINTVDTSDPDKMDSYILKKRDGATRLAKMLLEDATEVNFLVGRALNPAHQNPGMPVSLGLKLNLIKEITEALKRSGKRVTVSYF